MESNEVEPEQLVPVHPAISVQDRLSAGDLYRAILLQFVHVPEKSVGAFTSTQGGTCTVQEGAAGAATSNTVWQVRFCGKGVGVRDGKGLGTPGPYVGTGGGILASPHLVQPEMKFEPAVSHTWHWKV